jgi:hypothetical protein
MSNLVGENYASDAADNGVKLGEVPMSKETKGSWSELYYYEEKLISVIFYDPQSCYIADGEHIKEEDISLYTDDMENALLLLNKAKQK